MNSTKISIITITFNSEKTVEETINSIVSQNYTNLEYIIVDGGSTDSTLKIVNKYQDKISKLISERDEGISDAFNKGIILATGDVIGIINSDDILLPGALETIADNYEKEIDVYRGNTLIWNDKTGLKIKEIPSMKFNTLHFFLKVSHQSTFVKRSAYTKFGMYNTKFNFLMDVDLLTRFYKQKAVFKYIDQDLALYRRGGVTSTNVWKKKTEMKDYIRNNGGSQLSYFLYFYFNATKYYLKKLLTV